MIGHIVSRLIGEAPQGQRKYIMGMVALTLVWVAVMWWPGEEADQVAVATAGLDAITWIVGLIAGGLVGERAAEAIKARRQP